MNPTDEVLLDAAVSAAELKITLLSLISEAVESRSDEFRVRSVAVKIDRLQRQIDRGHELIAQIKDRGRRRAELEKIRRQHDTKTEQKTKSSSGPEVFRDERGRVIGYKHRWGNSDVFLHPGGKLAGREVDGKTLNAGGKLVGIGKMGVRQLGTSQKSGKPTQKRLPR